MLHDYRDRLQHGSIRFLIMSIIDVGRVLIAFGASGLVIGELRKDHRVRFVSVCVMLPGCLAVFMGGIVEFL